MHLTSIMMTIMKLLASDPEASFGSGVLLWIDRGVYNLVSKMFSIFMIVSQINMNVLYGMVSPIVSRLKALIIVFIIFKVGTGLIGYMIEPDKAAQGSKKLLINILVCAGLLIINETVFSAMNELSMMIIGKPENYSYTTLAQIADVTDDADSGLIMRLFFGKNGTITSSNGTDGLGQTLAANTLCALFPDMNASTCNVLLNTIQDGDGYDFDKLGNIKAKLEKTVDGAPGIALILGLYIVYSVALASIEIGVRMFKLIVMQLMAPIAIISVASDEGVKAKTFSGYVKEYISIYISAFTRIISILLVTVFVSQFFLQWDDVVGSVSANNHKLLTMVICIVAGYRFAGELPKLIDKVLGTHLGDSSTSGGFGKFLAGMVAAPALGAAGLYSGVRGGIESGAGVGGSIIGGLSGLASGASAGIKGNTIAEKFKNASEGRNSTRTRMQDIAAAGGAGEWLLGRAMSAVDVSNNQDSRVARFDRQMQDRDDLVTLIDEYDKTQTSAIKENKMKDILKKDSTTGNYTGYAAVKDGSFKDSAGNDQSIGDHLTSAYSGGYGDVKFGDDKGAYESAMFAYNNDYIAAKSSYDELISNPDSDISSYTHADGTAMSREEAIATAQTNLSNAEMNARADAGNIWLSAKNSINDDATKQARHRYEDAAKKVLPSAAEGTYTLDKDHSAKNQKEFIRQSKRDIEAQKKQFTSSAAYKRTHVPKGGNAKK